MTTAGAKGQQQLYSPISRKEKTKKKKKLSQRLSYRSCLFFYLFSSLLLVYQQHVQRAPPDSIYPESDGEEWREVFVLTLGANADLYTLPDSSRKKNCVWIKFTSGVGSSRAASSYRGYSIVLLLLRIQYKKEPVQVEITCPLLTQQTPPSLYSHNRHRRRLGEKKKN